MIPERWQQVKDILQETLQVAPQLRKSFLDSTCNGDQALREEVESLLLEESGTEGFLQSPLGFSLEEVLGEKTSWLGRRIGPYKVIEIIGEGGMGSVYRASRADEHYQKQVAIKVVKLGLGTPFALVRFRAERQILASLEHPNIARLLDGGTTEDGLPYVVMELVEGQPIDEYCAAQKLSVDERLSLFRKVCLAVQYAHQHLVVHRDLKPGNILVTADGTPKLLDFGIAKILDDGSGPAGTESTISFIRMLTPEYASPEQIRGETVTTASDVYSLGVILFLLLTGTYPYKFVGRSASAIVRTVCETEPLKPSTAARTTGYLSLRQAPNRGGALVRVASAAKLAKRLRGDLDNIVLMALRKDFQRRYASAGQFGEDIRRHLDTLPVVASHDTVEYRLSKFVARHKAGTAATVAAAAILVTALLGALYEARVARQQAHVAREERSRAEKRFNDVRSLANSLIFDVHDSIKDLPGSTPARKLIVDRALQYLNSLAQESHDDLSLQRELATAFQRVGLVQGHYLQSSLGDTQGSLESYEKALEIRKRIDAKSTDWNDRLALAESYRLVAHQRWAIGEKLKARGEVDNAIAISEALNKARANDFKILNELAFDYAIAGQIGETGRPGDEGRVEEDFRKAVAIDETLLRLNSDDLESQFRYAIDFSHEGDMVARTNREASLDYYQKELEIVQSLHQRSDDVRFARGVARAYGEIARVYDSKGKDQLSLENELKSLAIYQELIRVDPKNNLLQRGLAIEYANAASSLAKTGNASLSLAYMQKSIAMMHAIVASSPQNVGQLNTLSAMYMTSGDNDMKLHMPEAALKEYRQARAIFESFHQQDQGDTNATIVIASALKKMGEATALAGNNEQAEGYFREALSIVEPQLANTAPDLEALYTAADVYAGLGDLSQQLAHQSANKPARLRTNLTEAQSWYRKSLGAWRRIEHPSHVDPAGFDVGDPARVAINLQLCESALQNRGGP